MHTYYFLRNGEVAFIESFESASDAIKFKKEQFPDVTLAVLVKDQD